MYTHIHTHMHIYIYIYIHIYIYTYKRHRFVSDKAISFALDVLRLRERRLKSLSNTIIQGMF